MLSVPCPLLHKCTMSAPAPADSSTVAEMEETITRISSHKGVEGVLIMDRRGDTIIFSHIAVTYVYLYVVGVLTYIIIWLIILLLLHNLWLPMQVR